VHLLGPQGGVVDPGPSATLALGVVQRHIGLGEQLVCPDAVVRLRDPDRDPDVDRSPEMLNGSRSRAMMRSATASARARSWSISTTANSSPPKRAAVSSYRVQRRMRSPAALSSSSPARARAGR
jgi:hypothetical protein